MSKEKQKKQQSDAEMKIYAASCCQRRRKSECRVRPRTGADL